MDDFSRPQLRYGYRCTTVGGKPRQAKVDSYNDVALFAPSCAVFPRAIAQRDHLFLLDRDLFQASARKKAKPLPVWREERILCTLGSRQLRGLSLSEAASEQFRVRYVYQAGSVRRENRVGAAVRVGRSTAP